ncbi:MAG: hypothetical protein IJX92_03210 [Clostridia bacterium]|nr:hypothetical protein [Clostridia bacterium]
MSKSKKKILITTSSFILLESVLTALVQLTNGTLNVFVSFTAIVSAALFAITFFEKTTDAALMCIALICTVCADFFLVVTEPRHQLVAMIFFSVTQICYFLRLYMRQTKRKLHHAAARIILIGAAVILTVLILGEKVDALSLVSIFYFVNLLVNVTVAFIQREKSTFFAIGLLLFSLCDISIGLSVMDKSYIPLPNGSLLRRLANPGFNLAWIFYVPSQTLIAMSITEDKIKRVFNEYRTRLISGGAQEDAEYADNY